MKLDKNIRFLDIRKNLRLNQKDFAQELSIAQSQISSYEKDKDFPYKIMETLVLKYNIDLNWLITGKGEMFIQNNDNNVNVNNHSGNVAVNGTITIQTKDYADSEEIQELLEILKDVPKSWIDRILIKLKKQLQAFDDEF